MKSLRSKTPFYNFLIRPRDLLKITRIDHRERYQNSEDQVGYQRLAQSSRLKSIGKYIDEGGVFPTNVVINFVTKAGLRFDKKGNSDNIPFGELTLPKEYGCAEIIDGQHRLFGYAYSAALDNKDDKSLLTVLAFDDLPQEEQSKMFSDINSKQKNVNPNLLDDITADNKVRSDDELQNIAGLRVYLARDLDSFENSPFRGRRSREIKREGMKRKEITDKSWLGLNKLLGEKQPAWYPGPLWDDRGKTKQEKIEKTRIKQRDTIIELFNFIQSGCPDLWEKGLDGFLSSQISIRAFCLVFSALFKHEGITYASYDSGKILASKIKPLLEPIVEHFQTISEEETKKWKSYGAEDGVKRASWDLMVLIKKKASDFDPPGLAEYMAVMTTENFATTKKRIESLEAAHFKIVSHVLTEMLGTEWATKVDAKVIPDHAAIAWAKGGQSSVESWFSYINWRELEKILKEYKDALKPYFFVGINGAKAETSNTKWLVWFHDLCDTRNQTHHKNSAGILTIEMIDLTRDCYQHYEKIIDFSNYDFVSYKTLTLKPDYKEHLSKLN